MLILSLSIALMAAQPPAAEAYGDLVARVRAGDAKVDFAALRLACLESGRCDPRGSDEDRGALRKAAQAKDGARVAAAALKLIEAGFVNIEAHAAAAQAYRELEQMEKADFHRMVFRGLIDSILRQGDGKTKETAFRVIHTGEEYVMLQVLGLAPFGQQSLLRDGKRAFDLQEVDDPKTGKKVKVYFDISAFYGRL